MHAMRIMRRYVYADARQMVGRHRASRALRTEIMMCARYGDAEKLSDVLGGCDDARSVMHRLSIRGDHPLHLAVSLGHSDVVHVLLKTDACDVDAFDREEKTALHVAVLRQDLHMVDVLLRHGADTGVADGDENTSVFAALLVGNSAIVKALLTTGRKHGEQHWWTRNLGLHLAAMGGPDVHPTDVEALVCANADVDAVSKEGLRPLHLAAHFGNEPALAALLAAGADPLARGSQGHIPLHHAALHHDDGCLRTLLAATASRCVDSFDRKGRTPLFLACARARVGAARALLAAGAMPNAMDDAGETPLHLCAAGRKPQHLEIADLLLNAGADVDASNGARKTPLCVAVDSGHYDFVHMALRRGASPYVCLAVDGSFPVIESLCLRAKNGCPLVNDVVLPLMTVEYAALAALTNGTHPMAVWEKQRLHERIQQTSLDLGRLCGIESALAASECRVAFQNMRAGLTSVRQAALARSRFADAWVGVALAAAARGSALKDAAEKPAVSTSVQRSRNKIEMLHSIYK